MAKVKQKRDFKQSRREPAGCMNTIGGAIGGFTLGFGGFALILWFSMSPNCSQVCDIYAGQNLLQIGTWLGGFFAMIGLVIGYFLRLPQWVAYAVLSGFVGTLFGILQSMTATGGKIIVTDTAQGFLAGMTLGLFFGLATTFYFKYTSKPDALEDVSL